MTTKEAAQVLGMTPRRVVGLCNDGILEGAVKEGRSWNILRETVYSFGSTRNTKNSREILSWAVGTTSYTDIVRHSYYVDKTLLIKDLIDDQVPVILFTRPRRFGKTLAMDMLKTYFEKPAEGPSAEDTSVYFKDKKVWACWVKDRQKQGAYPVISITFKDAKFSDWDSTYASLKNVLRDEYLRHEELFSSPSLNAVEQDYLSRMQRDELTTVEYTRALLNLSRMLEKHHHSKVIILIDEYDTPIQQGHSKNFYNEVIQFMRNLLSGGLKDNPALAFSVLTGILRVSKENLFSGLNNAIVNSVLDDKYSEYFGFTTEEVNAMASYYGWRGKLPELREWYDGYRFGKTEIYNPWSVANYFYSDTQARPYWTNTSDNEIIHEIMASLTPEIAEELIALLQGKTVRTSLDMDVIYPRITDGTDTVFSFLMIAGYLRPVGGPVETEYGTFVELELPNKEIRRVYNTEVLSWIRKSVDSTVMFELEKALYLKDGKKLQESLRKYMGTCISHLDGAGESFYHGMMLGLTAGMSSMYYIRSNRESGEGRFDLALEPKDHHMPGMIMEFKAVKDPKDLPKAARGALEQIEAKHYDTDMRDRGIGEIVKYGIAFAGKNVEIAKKG